MKVLLKILLLPVSIIKWLKNGIEYLTLNSYLKNISISKIDAINGYEFEKYLEILLKSMGMKTKKTQDSRDYGADIIATYKKETIVIQAKLYYNHNVGISCVQEAKASKDYYQADKAVVITNSHYTKSAINLAKSTQVALIDREKLMNLINATKKEKIRLFNIYTII